MMIALAELRIAFIFSFLLGGLTGACAAGRIRADTTFAHNQS